MGIKGASIKGCSLRITNDKLETLEDYVKMVSRGHIQCLFLFGEGGIGKTETILRTLEAEKIEAVYLNGVVTPLELYNMLYEYNNRLIVLDDMEGLLNNKRTIAFLKGVTYGYRGKRMICYPTNSPLRRAPESFEFTGQIILCMNHFPDNDGLEALYKRTIYYELKMSVDEKKTLITKMSELPYKGISVRQRGIITKFLLENVDESTIGFSLRDLFKAYEIYKYKKSDWKELVLKLLHADTEVDIYIRCVERGGNIKSQINMFTELTGKSRRSFFRIRNKMKQSNS